MKRNIRKAGLIFSLVVGFTTIGATLSSCGNTSEVQGNTIQFEQTALDLYEGDSAKLKYTLSNEEATITWTTSDKEVATVKRGTVTAKGEGTCTIKAEVEGGNSATITVKVAKRTITISMTSGEINLDSAEHTLQLTASSSDKQEITWTSSDPAIASVDQRGLVTGLDVGKVTIIASRGLAKAECEITVIMPSRPKDYYRLTKLTNAECVADPGVWHFHVDGSLNSDYSFVETPLHENNSLSVKLGNLNLQNKKYFYFRYQPNFTIGNKYTVRYKIESTEDMKVNCSDGKNATKGKSLKANTPAQITYVGEMNASQPFHISIASCEALSNGKPAALKVTDIVFEEGDTTGGINDDKPEKSEHADESEYELEMMTNANVVNNTGAWYYSCDGTKDVDYTFSETPKFKDGVVTFSFANMMGQKPFNQIRFQPTMDVGKYYKISFRAEVSAKATLTYGTKEDSEHIYYEKVEVEKGSYDYEYTARVNNKFPFSINIVPAEADKPIALTVSNISIVETTAPVIEDENNYSLKKGTKAETVKEPGKWFYFADGKDGTDYQLASAPSYKEGTVTLSFSSLAGMKDTNQLRYQPTLEVGKKYQIGFKASLSAEGDLTYGSEHGGVKDYRTEKMVSGVEKDFEFKGTVDEAVPFSIGVKPKDFNAPMELKIHDIVVSEVTEEEPPVEAGYDLAWGNKATTISNSGTWYYMCDGTEGKDFSFVDGKKPHFNENTVTLPLKTMTEGKTYQLRYQPTMNVNEEYTLDFDVNVTADASIIVGKDGLTKTIALKADTKTHVTYDGKVDAANPFFIQVKPVDYSFPITLTASGMDFKKKEATASESYTLQKKSNADVIKTPGTWCYMADGNKGSDYAFVDDKDPSFENGKVTFAFRKMTDKKTYQLRYQPKFEKGAKYSAKMKIKINAAGYVLYGNDYKKATPNVSEETEISYTGTVSDSPFILQIKPADYLIGFTLEVSDIVFEAI